MTRAQILSHLLTWQQAHNRADRAWTVLEGLTGFTDSESPIGLAVWGTFQDYTATLAKLLGDRDGWLDWYAWENDMGAKSLSVTINHGKPRAVRTLQDLARLLAHK